jgi:23S rRNA pseudouridine1911/1915/1917 synthase
MDEYLFEATDAAGARVDRWLNGRIPDMTRSALQRLFDGGLVYVNGEKAAKSRILKTGDSVEVTVPAPIPPDVQAERIPVGVIYEDDALLVIDKPKGMVVHPAAGHSSGTLVNALLYRCGDSLSSVNGVIRPGIVHRIDKDTSGLLVVAKSNAAHAALSEQIKAHAFTREYRAVVCGRPKNPSGLIDAPIGRHKTDRKKMGVVQTGKKATTEYDVLEAYDGYSLMRFRLFTGRTHQIRVHAAYIGHPVLGDAVYGKKSPLCDGQCLHAAKLGFVHPVTNGYLEFESGLPEYFLSVLSNIR